MLEEGERAGVRRILMHKGNAYQSHQCTLAWKEFNNLEITGGKFISLKLDT